jgi:hypothetical protein
VSRAEIVQNRGFVTGMDEAFGDDASDEPGSAGHEHAHDFSKIPGRADFDGIDPRELLSMRGEERIQ